MMTVMKTVLKANEDGDENDFQAGPHINRKNDNDDDDENGFQGKRLKSIEFFNKAPHGSSEDVFPSLQKKQGHRP